MVRRSPVLVLVVVALILGAGSAVGAPVPVPPLAADLIGQWTVPFEEGGAASPRCVTLESGEMVCKPAAQAMAMLPDGRVFYYNGFEGQENVRTGVLTDFGARGRDSTARLLDLRRGTPAWSTPSPATGGGTDPNIRPGHRGTDDPLGMAGVPGRPGDGFVGSTWGRLGGPAHDPTSSPDDVQANDGDLFCGDVSQLDDGRLLIAGGSDFYNEPALLDRDEGAPADAGVFELQGIRASRIFDPATDRFTQTGSMKFNRWYPATVTMADGRVLVVGGGTKTVKNAQGGQVRRTETFDPATNSWTENYTGPASETALPLQPRLHLLPNGKIFYGGVGTSSVPFALGPDEALYSVQQFFDIETSQWETVGPGLLTSRNGAQQLILPLSPPYDTATLLTFGGTVGFHPSGELAVPLAALTTVDAAGQVTNTATASLHNARWFASGMLLPDGTVLAVGGADKDAVSLPGTEIAVRTPEVYDPATGRWTEVAAQSRDRAYHNAALLLPDGRVLLGGHAPLGFLFGPPREPVAPGFASTERDPSFEIWSPPYLFRGDRPTITSAQAGIRWGQEFDIESPEAGDIESVVLMRTPSPEHVVDSDARSLNLAFASGDGDRLRAVAPPNGVVAPPGWYYLFVNRRSPQGPIPSVARMVHVGNVSDPAPAQQPMDGAAATVDDSISPPAGSADTVSVALAATSRGPEPGPLLPVVAGAVAAAATLSGRRWLLAGQARKW